MTFSASGDLLNGLEFTPKKQRNAHPERELQIQINKLARFVDVPHVFLAFDRSKKQSERQHMREKERGLRAGTYDTLTSALGCVDYWCELKARGKLAGTTDNQDDFGNDMRAAGRHTHVADTVAGWLAGAKAAGIPFMPGADLAAMRMDALLESAAAKREQAKPPKVRVKRVAPRGRKETPSRRALAIAARFTRP